MIIRSGMIQRRAGLAENSFSDHWRDNHGPLALKLPLLCGYVQNRVVARGRAGSDGLLHAIDGISQLWFDSLDAMARATACPEQDACIRDIADFLDKVTLAIQEPGDWRGKAERPSQPAKVMAIYAGDGTLPEITANIEAGMRAVNGESIRYRINPVVTQNVIVDAAINRSAVPVNAIVEILFDSEVDRSCFLELGALNSGSGPTPAAVLAVEEMIFRSPPDAISRSYRS